MSRRVLILLALISILAASTIANSAQAWAAPKGKCIHKHRYTDAYGDVQVICDQTVPIGSKHQSAGSGGGNDSVTRTKPQPTYAQRVAEIRKKNEEATQAYIDAVKQANDHSKTGECAFTPGGSFTGVDCSPAKPKLIAIPPRPKGSPAVPAPPVPPEEAAYLAIAANLKINPSGVGIGPDPALSKWKMAVVGHSYWLWATGPTQLGPISASAAGMTVSLDARITSVTFNMGDGHTVTCDGPGTPYPGDEKGLYAKSPTCGYAYQITSQHEADGVYPVRITTYWSVAYSTPGGSGEIPIVLSTIRDLKVGELQTVIVH